MNSRPGCKGGSARQIFIFNQNGSKLEIAFIHELRANGYFSDLLLATSCR